MSQSPNQNESDFYDTRRQLGFKIGDSVTISNSFFRNHNIRIIYLGEGVVRAKILPTRTTLPALIIEMPVSRTILTEPNFRKLIVPRESDGRVHGTVMLKIHPLYVELNKRVKDGKKNNSSSR